MRSQTNKLITAVFAAALLALLAVAAHPSAAANAAKVNATTNAINATAVKNATSAANVTASNATAVYITTPSGNIHLVYVSNNTMLVINYNHNKVLTVNLKTTVIYNNTVYYIHLVGRALGSYNATYISALLSQVARDLSAGNQTAAISALKKLASYVVTSNATKEAEAHLMITAKSLNSTKPNATYLKLRLEYEVERQLKKVNYTDNELEIKAVASDLKQLSTVLRAIAAQLSQIGINASDLDKAASALANLSTTLKEVELKLGNGTVVEVHRVGHGYKVEVQIGGDHEHKGGHHDKSKSDEDSSSVGQAPSGGGQKAKGGDEEHGSSSSSTSSGQRAEGGDSESD